MNKSHAYNEPEWKAEQERLERARDQQTGTITRKQTRLTDNTTKLLRQEQSNA